MRSKLSMYCGTSSSGISRSPRVLAEQLRRVIAGDDFARAVEAHNAPRGIKDHDQRADGVEHGGHEVALDRKRGLNALLCACRAVSLAHAHGKLQPRCDHVAQRLQRVELLRRELARGRVEHGEAADGDGLRRHDGRAGVEAIAAVAERNASGRVAWVATRVGDLVDAVAGDGVLARQRMPRHPVEVHAMTPEQHNPVLL